MGEQVADQLRLRTACLHILHRQLAKVFGAWRTVTVQTGSAAQILLRLLNRAVASSFTAWFERHQQLKVRSKTPTNRSTAACRPLLPSRSQLPWRANLQKCAKMARRLLNAKLIAAFSNWEQHVRNEAKAGAAIRRLLNRAVAAVFGSWRDRTEQVPASLRAHLPWVELAAIAYSCDCLSGDASPHNTR